MNGKPWLILIGMITGAKTLEDYTHAANVKAVTIIKAFCYFESVIPGPRIEQSVSHSATNIEGKYARQLFGTHFKVCAGE
jgi:hypothetical protein